MLKLRTPYPRFVNAKEIIHGVNSIKALRGLQAVKVALIIGLSLSKKEELLKKITSSINCHQLHVIIRSWEDEPTLSSLQPVLDELIPFQPDCIIAIGGGSVIDGVKLVWAFYEHPGLSDSVLSRAFALPKLRGKARFCAIPTTAGTGSEVSSSAVFFDPEKRKKVPVVTHDFLPDLVILDPNLLVGIPRNILLSTVIDALSHAIEGYVSKLNNPLMDRFSELAISSISNHILKAIDFRNEEILAELQYAAMLAGWVQNHCVVGVSHALAHQMGSFKVPHGVANAIFLPLSIRFNSQDSDTKQRYALLAKNSGVGDSFYDLEQLIIRISQFGSFSLKLSDYGFTEEYTKDLLLLQNALDDPGARFNPVSLDHEKLTNLLENAL